MLFVMMTSSPVKADTGPSTDFPVWSTAEEVNQACERALKKAEQARTDIKAMSTPQLDTLLATFNRLQLALDKPSGLSSLLFNTHPSKEVREAAQGCEQRIAKLQSSLGVDRELYERFAAIPETQVKAAQPHPQRVYQLMMRDFKRSGVNLPEAQRKRLKAINEELTQLSQQFSKNINSDTKRLRFDPKRLKGLPDDFMAGRKVGDDGKVEFTTDYPDFFPFQRYVDDRGARAELYRAFSQRGYPANESVLLQVLKLRHEYAQLLGESSWAAYNAGDKMAESAETIDQFIKQLEKITRPISDRELVQLLKRIRKDDPKATRVESWDRFYYTDKLRQELHSFDAKQVRPYLAYQRVKDGVFDLYGELFGLTFKKDKDQPVWSPSVEAYLLYRGDKLIGRFFLDMHPRDNKYKHAAMFPLQTGLTTGRLPAASLVCNFPEPKDGQPGLMEHSQVTTLFHEFGHLIHHLLAQETRWVRLGGISTEWDFVEAPSQILEEWARSHEVLKRFATHVKTGDPIPAKLVDQLRQAEEFGKGIQVMRQIFYTAYSFYLHHRDPHKLDLKSFTTSIYDKYSPYPAIEGGAIYANFGHLMGYSSMYYTYQWSLVIAKDLWTRFESEGLMSPKVAKDYADQVLAPGGTRPAAKLAEGFLGRPYRMDAYKAWLSR